MTVLEEARMSGSLGGDRYITPEYLAPLPQVSTTSKNCILLKGLTLVQALRGRVGAKGCWRIFFKNPTTQLRVVWGLTEKKCEQTPKFACFSV